MTTQNPNEAAEGREPEQPETGATDTGPTPADAPATPTAPVGATGSTGSTGSGKWNATGAAGSTGSTAAGSTAASTPGAAPEGDEDIWLYDEAHGDPVPNTGVAATFLPGIDAAAVIAAVMAVLGAAVYLLVYPLVQVRSGAASWDNYKNNIPQAKQDPFATERFWLQYQSWGHIILGLVAILIALLVLGMWTHEKNKLWSRSVAQAALVLGIAVVIFGILLKTGAIGGDLPSKKSVEDKLTSASVSGSQ